MGHSGCGGIGSLMMPPATEKAEEYSFIRPWMNIVKAASEFTEEEKKIMNETSRISACEKRAILISLDNLVSFPWIKEAIKSEILQLHGWYFDIKSGNLSEYNWQEKIFKEIS